MTEMRPNALPPAEGIRLDWQAVPIKVRRALEEWLGSPVTSVASKPKGFSPGVAATLLTADNRRVFVKAVGPEPNPDVPSIHRREAQIAALLPITAPVPRLLWSYDDADDTGWVVLVFENVEGKHPGQPWLPNELTHVLDALVAMSDVLTPSPVKVGLIPTASDKFDADLCGWRYLEQGSTTNLEQLDAWSSRHLASLAKIEATASPGVEGNTLLHFDIREDNLLLTADTIWVVDWPHACVGAAWVDMLCFAPSVTMQGGPPPENIIAYHPATRQADFDVITAAVVSLAGFFTHRALQPPPPGLPTLRQFQAAQGLVAREWAAQRLGWN